MKLVVLASPATSFKLTLLEENTEDPIFQKQMFYEDFLSNIRQIMDSYSSIDEILLFGPTSYLENIANKLAEIITEDIQISIIIDEPQKSKLIIPNNNLPKTDGGLIIPSTNLTEEIIRNAEVSD